MDDKKCAGLTRGWWRKKRLQDAWEEWDMIVRLLLVLVVGFIYCHLGRAKHPKVRAWATKRLLLVVVRRIHRSQFSSQKKRFLQMGSR